MQEFLETEGISVDNPSFRVDIVNFDNIFAFTKFLREKWASTIKVKEVEISSTIPENRKLVWRKFNESNRQYKQKSTQK